MFRISNNINMHEAWLSLSKKCDSNKIADVQKYHQSNNQLINHFKINSHVLIICQLIQ